MSRLPLMTRSVVTLASCLALAARGGGAPPTLAQGDSGGVAIITGQVTVTNPFILEDSAEPYMALIDLTALVKRDRDLPLPFPDQTLAGLQGELATGATFTLALHIEPRGEFNDVSHGQGKGQGVMLFAVAFATNAIGDPFQGPYEWHGWPSDLDSLQFAAPGDQVAGGYMLVWSPDDQEQFPTDYGADGQLFSPTGP